MIRLRSIPSMLAMIPSVVRGIQQTDLENIKRIARQAFPNVRQMSTAQLAELMTNETRSLLIIDVRSPDEFAVSRLAHAENLQTAEEIAGEIEKRKPSATILYCSVGFRSSSLADQLRRRGVDGVINLEGSIFQWANEERPLYRGDEIVRELHPYGRRWAGLLRADVVKPIM